MPRKNYHTIHETNMMRLKRNAFLHIIPCMLFLSIYSCSRHEGYNPDAKHTISRVQTTVDTLSGYPLGELVPDIHRIEIRGDYLIVLSGNREALFSIFRTSDYSLVSSFGAIGHAANEFTSIPIDFNFGEDDKGNTVIYAQESPSHIKIIDFEKSIEKGTCIICGESKPTANTTSRSKTYQLSDDMFFARNDVGYDDPRDGILYPPTYKITSYDKLVKEWKPYGGKVTTKVPNIVMGKYDSRIRISPDRTKAVEAMLCTDIIHVFDFKAKTMDSYIDNSGYDFEWFDNEVNENNFLRKSRIYNVGVSVTDNYILIIRDGRLAIEFEEDMNEESPTHISISDWGCSDVKDIVVHENLRELAYDENNDILYGLSVNGKIYKYEEFIKTVQKR